MVDKFKKKMGITNTPYRKQFDANGVLIPLQNGEYLNEYPNRRERRQHLNKGRFRGNNKGVSIVVVQETPLKTVAYKKTIQYIGNKAIFHTTLKTK